MRLRPWTSLLAVLLISFLVAWMASQVTQPQDDTRPFEISFREEGQIYGPIIVTGGKGEHPLALDVDVANVTGLSVRMTGRSMTEAEGTGNEVARLALRPPGGSLVQGEAVAYRCDGTGIPFSSTCSTGTQMLVENHHIATVPGTRTYRALDAEEAARKAFLELADTSLTGRWNGTLTLSGDIEYDSMTVQLDISVRYFRAIVEPSRNASA